MPFTQEDYLYEILTESIPCILVLFVEQRQHGIPVTVAVRKHFASIKECKDEVSSIEWKYKIFPETLEEYLIRKNYYE